MSQRLGIQKLVLLNSGGFRCAEFDMTRAVHLAADNNGGKSTLVNALQFLFVDDIDTMVFGDHDLASTRHHYFGQAPSYIVFECLTETGPQCLVVFGSGDIAGSRFARLVYRGVYDRRHYEDDQGRLADVTRLQQALLTADVLEVKHSRLWRVLCRPTDLRGDDHESGRLGILPLKRVEDYHSFREVFIRLLGLSKATAEDLKRLLIACSCQSIQAVSVDVKRDYADQFSRLERDDLELEWLKAVAPQIDQGLSLRAVLSDTSSRQAQTAAEARRTLRRCAALERGLVTAVRVQREQIDARLGDLRKQRDALHQDLGGLDVRLGDSQEALAKLDAAQRRWETVTDLELSSWRERQSELHRTIQETQTKLRESETHDLPSLERECQRKQRELDQKRQELADWGNRTAGYLNTLGFAPNQVGTLFTLINPDLARASHREVFGASPSDAVTALVNETLAAHRDRRFLLNGVTVDTSRAHVPDDLVSQNRDAAEERVRFLTHEVTRVATLLEVARNAKAARDSLQRSANELDSVSEKLREQAQHRQAYANRPALIEQLTALQEQVRATKDDVARIERDEREWTDKASELNTVQGDLKRWENCRANLTTELKVIEVAATEDRLEQDAAPLEGDALTLKRHLQQACDRLDNMNRTLATMARKRSEDEAKIAAVQQHIAAEARKRRARVAVFDQDVEREWHELARLREALGESEQHLTALWNAMFKSLAGELDLLRRSVAEIKKRASRINADLKRYRVSNLESVELHVEHDTTAYTTIERMTSADSMFLNERDVEDAKRELRQWIVDGKTIELRELFTIRIRIQNHGEVRPVEVASLDVIGSEGTGMTAKVMIYLQLLRSVIDDQHGAYQMHFYLDEIGRLDDRNLRATSEMAFRRGFTPITAEPEPRAEALAHPEVKIYHLGMHGKSFEIIEELTYVARAKRAVQKVAQ